MKQERIYVLSYYDNVDDEMHYWDGMGKWDKLENAFVYTETQVNEYISNVPFLGKFILLPHVTKIKG